MSVAATVTDETEDWNTRHRAEGPLNRADRNFAELLQELRVVFTGVQILFGFLLTLSLSDRFKDLDAMQHALFVATLAGAATSSTLIVAPVAAHRILFQRNRKRELVRHGHQLALAGLCSLALTLSAGLMLVLDIAVGRLAGIVGTATLLTATAMLWVLVPLYLRRDSRAAPALPDPEG
ncbi:DUF6328 family protein [Pseudonocardia sp. RS11V-5]|uniref:DUF6328 family protein n=1 Tax=Pseudonocardia terrae TaxID=2905831 RepID=UPI001E4EFFA3|nr:DUF6328 family protein [Pseudonocardia terrae]MCE3552920.1 DUF6328 family protein [Pseudonocardia terrae]